MKANEFISERRKQLNLTLEQVAIACGVTRATVQRWESGDIQSMRSNKIKALAKVLKVSPAILINDEIDMNDKSVSTHNKIPMFTEISCGHGLFIDDIPEEYLTVPDKYIHLDKSYFANVAHGDSMIGKGINDGDTLIFERTNALQNGDIGSFCINDEKAVCKIFRKFPNGIILLESANEAYQPIMIDVTKGDCFRIIGKLILKFSKV